MKDTMDVDTARRRHDDAVYELKKATDRLILMCKVKLIDLESIQDQACVVQGKVSAEYATRVQLAKAVDEQC